MQPLLQTHTLTTGYPAPRKSAHIVSQGLNLSLYTGELVCLIGPNGAGKSTLMQTLAGMLKPIAGRVTLDGRDIHVLPPLALARAISLVLTERPTTGLLTARELVALGRHPHTDWTGQLSPHDQAVIDWALDTTGTSAFADRQVSELSDGQRQKVMIARALAQQPQVMLLDEPTAFLDLPRRVETMRLLKALAHETGCAILLSTHDLDLALRSADQLWMMTAPEAQIVDRQVYVGAPEDLVLRGVFERVFAGEGVRFNRSTGTFDVSERQQGTVHLVSDEADALTVEWTRRALERAGFSVATQEVSTPRVASVEVAVIQAAGRQGTYTDPPTGWKIMRGHQYAEVTTLYDLVSWLRGTTSNPPPD